MFYKTTACQKWPLLIGPKSGCLIYTGLTVLSGTILFSDFSSLVSLAKMIKHVVKRRFPLELSGSSVSMIAGLTGSKMEYKP